MSRSWRETPARNETGHDVPKSMRPAMPFLKLSATALAVLLTFSATAKAQEATDCDKFKWSVARELAWFAAASKAVASGAIVNMEDRGFAMAIKPTEAAGFVMEPERAPRPGTFGGVLNFDAVDKPGAYQITLSKEAWIDVIQGGARVKSTAFSGQEGCPSVRKSVRFDLVAGPLIVEISNAESDSITLAIAPVQ
jgi:hypothetical protein